MLFHSPDFLIFLTVFCAGLPLFKGKARIVYVSLASFLFYGWWYPPYLLLLISLTIYAYLFGDHIAFAKRHLGLVIALGLTPLAVFKYSAFVFDNISFFSGSPALFVPDWALPIGISFMTFTAIAYIIDGVRGDRNRAPSFWHAALFISFFPQLIAGPILRAKELMPQLGQISIDKTMIGAAALLFALGVVKKVGIADQIAPYVETAFSSPDTLSGAGAVLALYGFSIQIYCDFSGYTDMALALGLLFSIHLPANFHSPYGALSVRDFWRRWHVTLSRWLRDYLYIPFGGSRMGLPRTLFALLATMLIGGLWHGAAWTFVVWGAIHGGLIALEHVAGAMGLSAARIPKALRWFIVFHLVTLAWAFFRASNVEDALAILSALGNASGMADLMAMPFIVVLIVAVMALHSFDRVQKVKTMAERLPLAVCATVSIMLILIGAALSLNNPSIFIYFDF